MPKYVGTVSAEENVAYTLAPTTEDGIIDSVTGAFTAPFMKESEFMDAKGVFWTVVVWTVIGVAIGSIWARYNVNKGQGPYLYAFG